MEDWMIIIGIVVLLAVIITIRVIYELRHLKITELSFHSEKVTSESGLKAVFLTDLHSRSYGAENEILINTVRQSEPDYIFLGGDMLTDTCEKKDSVLFALLNSLVQIAPVIYAPGNHEQRVLLEDSERRRIFHEKLAEAGVRFLQNEKVELNQNINIYGLDIDSSHFGKVRPAPLLAEELEEGIGRLDQSRYNILMAHSPKFFEVYAEYGADLILSGHYHGGAVRLPLIGGVVSPQFRLFPKYSGGLYTKGGSNMFVSTGCGSHKINLRLFNRPEVVVIDIRS